MTITVVDLAGDQLEVVDVTQPETTLGLIVVSGPRGPQGVPGAAAVVYVQSTPLASWSISHPFGRLPIVSVYIAGVEVIADVEATSSTVTVTFSSPVSGVAALA